MYIYQKIKERKFSLKKSLSVIFAALIMAAVVTACTSDTTSAPTSSASGIQSSAESQTQQSDTFPEEKVTAEDLPKAVDLRDYNGKNYVTAVKRQAFGDCWSFGNITAAESSYLYENDLGAINEAMSDIMGNLVEYIVQDTEDENWILGENAETPIRSMSNPRLYAQPEYVWDVFYGAHTDNPVTINDRGGVHLN